MNPYIAAFFVGSIIATVTFLYGAHIEIKATRKRREVEAKIKARIKVRLTQYLSTLSPSEMDELMDDIRELGFKCPTCDGYLEYLKDFAIENAKNKQKHPKTK